MSEIAYQHWKMNRLKDIFEVAGLRLDSQREEDSLIKPRFAPPVWTQMAGRRRARLSYRRTAQTLIIGFTGRASHFIYPLESCGVLQKELKQLVMQLNSWAAPHLPAGQSGQIAVNLLSSGADILLLPDEMLPDEVLTALSATLESLPACRLSVCQPGSDVPLLLVETALPVLQLDRAVGGLRLFHRRQFPANQQRGRNRIDTSCSAGSGSLFKQVADRPPVEVWICIAGSVPSPCPC